MKASNRELILSSAKYYFLLILGTGKKKKPPYFTKVDKNYLPKLLGVNLTVSRAATSDRVFIFQNHIDNSVCHHPTLNKFIHTHLFKTTFSNAWSVVITHLYIYVHIYVYICKYISIYLFYFCNTNFVLKYL